MFNVDLAIKFGSNEIIVFRKGFGIIAKEPAYLAVEIGKQKVKAVGKDAKKLFVSKASGVEIFQPIVNSEIVNEKMAQILLESILKNVVKDRFLLTHLNAIVAVPCALNEKQLALIKKVLHACGVNKVVFVQNAVCARANLELDAHAHLMVVDIGKYITDISVLTDYSFDFGRMYFIGGQDMDKSITTFIADNHNLTVTDNVSEEAKNEVASLYDRDLYSTEYLGADENGKFVRHNITANEVRVAASNIYDKIFALINEILLGLDKTISADIFNTGVMFVGGASSISGLYEYAKKKLDMPIIVPDDTKDCVILGAGKLLNTDKEFLKIEV